MHLSLKSHVIPLWVARWNAEVERDLPKRDLPKLKFDWDSTFVTYTEGLHALPWTPPCYLFPTMYMASALKTEFTQAQCYLM